eukprot:jgi/Hompol1/4489/HPOL_000551-RA
MQTKIAKAKDLFPLQIGGGLLTSQSASQITAPEDLFRIEDTDGVQAPWSAVHSGSMASSASPWSAGSSAMSAGLGGGAVKPRPLTAPLSTTRSNGSPVVQPLPRKESFNWKTQKKASQEALHDHQEQLQLEKERIERIQRARFPCHWLLIIDSVIIIAFFVLSSLFIPPSLAFEQYLWDAICNTFISNATLFDVVLLSVSRSLALASFSSAIRKHKGLRDALFLRICLYTFLDFTVAATVAKLVRFAYAPKNDMDVPGSVVYVVVGTSLVMGAIEIAVLVVRLSEWIMHLEFDGVDDEVHDRRIQDIEGGNTDDVSADKRIRWDMLLQLMKPDLMMLLLGFAMLVINSATNLVIPYYFGQVVDAVSAPGDSLEGLKQVMMQLLAWFAVSGVTGFIRSLCFTLTGYRIVRRLRRQVFRAISMQDIAFFDTSTTGELVSRLSSDAQVLQSSLTVNVSMLLRFLFQAIGTVIVMFSLSWKLTLIMLVCVPLVVVGAAIYGNHVSNLQEVFQDKLAESQSVAQEVFSQIRTVRSFAKEQYSQSIYNNAIEETHQVGVRISVLQALFMGLTGFLPQIAMALVLYSGARMVISGEITGGLLTSFSEHLVQEAIDRAMQGVNSFNLWFHLQVNDTDRYFWSMQRSVIVIAHRLSTIMGATKIAVIEHGEVVEYGNHTELMAIQGRGVYRSLVNRQLKSADNNETTNLNDAEGSDLVPHLPGWQSTLAGVDAGEILASPGRLSTSSMPPLEDAEDVGGSRFSTHSPIKKSSKQL